MKNFESLNGIALCFQQDGEMNFADSEGYSEGLFLVNTGTGAAIRIDKEELMDVMLKWLANDERADYYMSSGPK